MAKFQLFFSYSHRDLSNALQIVKRLEADGFVVWLDRHEVDTNDSIGPQLARGIRCSQCVVILVSKNSAGSQWVREELSTANFIESQSNGTVVVPLVLGDCELFGFYVNKKPYRIEPDSLQGIEQFIDELKKHTQGMSTPNSPFSVVYRGETVRETGELSRMNYSYGDVRSLHEKMCPKCGSSEVLCRRIEENYDSGDWWYENHYFCSVCMASWVEEKEARPT